MNNTQLKKTNPKVLWLLAACLSVFLLLAWGASAAPPTTTTTTTTTVPVEEPGFLDRLRAKMPSNPFAMDEEEKLEIVREYNAETARLGQQTRVNAAAATRNAEAARVARATHEQMLRALRACVNNATNR